jgi:hypothetical protein
MHATCDHSVLTVIVKGSAQDAAKAASERGIPFAFVRENRLSAGALETIGHVSAEWERAVQAWFCEEPRQAPFPVGACLWYGKREG